MDAHGRPSWRNVERSTIGAGLCPKLKSYWAFHGCGYEKSSWTCAEQDRIACCRLPYHDLRTGRLNQTATALYLFIRDVANGDLVSWIDSQLRRASVGAKASRLSRTRDALIGPLRHVYGVSDKVLNMALSDLLMAAPRTKRNWFETGASMVVVDTLTHNWLHRTGILRRFASQHAYGPACYRPNGCADIITQISLPAFPRSCGVRNSELLAFGQIRIRHRSYASKTSSIDWSPSSTSPRLSTSTGGASDFWNSD